MGGTACRKLYCKIVGFLTSRKCLSFAWILVNIYIYIYCCTQAKQCQMTIAPDRTAFDSRDGVNGWHSSPADLVDKNVWFVVGVCNSKKARKTES